MRSVLTAACLLAGLAAGAGADVHSGAGTTSWTFLKIGAGARYAALADAGAALADDATACHWNPARLAEIGHAWSAQAQHGLWIDSTTVDEFYLATGYGRHRLGVSVRLFSSGDIPLRGDEPTAEPLACYSLYDFAGGLSYAFAPSPQLSAGVTYRRLYEKIYLDAGHGWSLDGGLNINLLDGALSLAGTAANIGPRLRMRHDLFRLPTAFTLAGSYLLPWRLRGGTFRPVLAAVKPIDGGIQLRSGIEYWWRELAAARAGYKSGHGSETFSAGLGIRWRNYTLDYAFVPHRYDLGAAHRLSLDLRY
ncbi:MAG: PorV/PorQ family protein [Candidatus Edwardsbacteria bacterium]|nr:PorV/PorQ family protein [Candidatus Edwardsbacteria bacterium]